jgi:hypothetical protein
MVPWTFTLCSPHCERVWISMDQDQDLDRSLDHSSSNIGRYLGNRDVCILVRESVLISAGLRTKPELPIGDMATHVLQRFSPSPAGEQRRSTVVSLPQKHIIWPCLACLALQGSARAEEQTFPIQLVDPDRAPVPSWQLRGDRRSQVAMASRVHG